MHKLINKVFLVGYLLSFGSFASAAVTDCKTFPDLEKQKACMAAVESSRAKLSEFKVNFGEEVNVPDCERRLISAKLPGKRESLYDFLQATCELAANFDTITGLRSDLSSDPTKISVAAIDDILILLRNSMNRGLSGLEYGLAQYFEFLLEGLRASVFYEEYARSDATRNIKERLLFCSARRNAQTLLDRVDWSTVVFNYSAKSQARLNTIVPRLVADLMNEAGPLSDDKGPYCLEIKGFAEADIISVVDKSLNAAIQPYFAATSPISGMIQRRLDRLTAPAEALSTKVKTLQGQASTQATILSQLKEGTSGLINDSNVEVNRYQESFTTVVAVAKWFERFKKGLFLDPVGENTLTVLRETYDRVYDPVCGSLASALGKVDPTASCKNSVDAPLAKAESIVELAGQLSSFKRNFESIVAGEKTYNAATRYLCAVYYCQILPEDADSTALRPQLLNRYCKTSSNKQLCLPTATSKNGKFEITEGGTVQRQGVEEICRAAEFSPKWIKSKLSLDEAGECIEAMTTSAFAP